MEKWKEVAGSCGNYLVSDKGKIKNAKSGRVLTVSTWRGYERLRLFKISRRKTFKVHRLVAEAFIPNPNNLPQVNHKDGNKRNNCVENLEWCTNEENIKHSWENGLREGNKRFYERKKKKVVAISVDGKDVIHFNSVAEAKRHFNTNHISDVLNGHREQTKGFKFMLGEQYGSRIKYS